MESMWLYRLPKMLAPPSLTTKGHTQLYWWQCAMPTTGKCLWNIVLVNFELIILDRFTLVDIGETGCQSDGGVFANSLFGQAFDSGALCFPQPSPLPATTSTNFPFVIVGDEAFPLKKNLLRPYPGRYLPGKLKLLLYYLHRPHIMIFLPYRGQGYI